MTRLLIVAPHPDDEVIGACGLLLRARALSYACEILYLCGTPDSKRGIEAQRACNALGATAYFGGMEPDAVTVAGAERALSTIDRSDSFTVAPHPFDIHSDHCAANAAVENACGSWLEYEVWSPMSLGERGYDSPCYSIVLSEAEQRAKADYIRMYPSQNPDYYVQFHLNGINRVRGEGLRLFLKRRGGPKLPYGNSVAEVYRLRGPKELPPEIAGLFDWPRLKSQ